VREPVGELLEDAMEPVGEPVKVGLSDPLKEVVVDPLNDPVTLIDPVPVLSPDGVPPLAVRPGLTVPTVALPEGLGVPPGLTLPPLGDPDPLATPVPDPCAVAETMLPEGELVKLCIPVELPAELGVCPLGLTRPLALPRDVGLVETVRDLATVVVPCVPDPIPVELPEGL